jgi:pilus assembly protein CpaC
VQGQEGRVAPSPALRAKVNELLDEVLESEAELSVTLRRSKILRMKQNIFRASIADPSLVEVVAFGTREVEIIGKQTGSTTLTLWTGNEQQPQILSVLVNITRDDAVEDLRRLQYGELQDLINEMFPNSKVQLIPIADKLIVRGQARDEQEATQIMTVIRQRGDNGNSGVGGFGGGGGAQTSQGAAAEPFPDAVQIPGSTVLSLLKVPGEKQIMLKVRIAELKRSAVRKLGVDFSFNTGDLLFSSVLAGTGNILATGTFDSTSFNILLNALESNGSAKILAEPNLVVLSGQPASFISGGEFAVPTVVGVGGAQAATTHFKGYGTQLRFLPTVLDKDRIRLNVMPTFSTLNSGTSVNGIFGLDTRSVATTVDLREGQVLAIAGLLQEQQRGDLSQVPVLGRIPLVKLLAQNKTITRDETELIILVSPELVHPLEPDEAPSILPGMEVTEPDDLDFFLDGDIEGFPNHHYRSTVWPLYRDRLKRCKLDYKGQCQSEDYYIHGPHGFSN